MAATFRIDVVIDPSKASAGARKVRGEIVKTDNAADKLRSTIRNTFAGIGIGLIVRELGQAADAYTNLQNRVRTVTEGQEELDSVTRQLFQIANDTRSAFDATAEVYARTALAAKDLGISQEQTLRFTKSLNQAVTLGGSAAEEARAGMIQLSQGLASGALRGDELRSVLEQLPVVADVIAKSLGVTRGELRELGSQGKITSTIILDAFEGAREELDERFGKSVPTIGQAFTVLTNNLTEFVGAADQATGTSAALSGFIILIADNVGVAAGGVLALSSGIAVAYIPATIGATTVTTAFSAALTRMSALLLANPFGVAVAGIVAAGVAVSVYADKMIEAEEASLRATEAGEKFGLTDFGKVGADIIRVQENLARVNKQIAIDAAAGNDVNESAIRIAERYTSQLELLTGQQEALANGTAKSVDEAVEQQKAMEATANSVQAVVDAITQETALLAENKRERGIQIALLREVEAIERKRGEGSVTDAQREELEGLIRSNAELTRRAEVLERIQGPQQEFEADLAQLNTLLADGTISQEQFNEQLAAMTTNLEGIDLSTLNLGEGTTIDLSAIEALLAGTRQVAEETKRTADESIAALQLEQAQLALLAQGRVQEAELLRITNDLKRQGIEVTPEQAQRIADLNAENDALALQAQLLNEIVGPQQQFAATQEALNALLAQGSIDADQYAAALENAAQAAGMLAEGTNAAGDAAGELPEKIGPAEQAVNQALAGSFRAAEDALVGFVRTGEFEFEKFVDSLLDQIARLLVRQALLAIFGGGGGAAAGAVGGAFAEGGEFSGGAPILVGEEGPEIITPKGSGEVIPAGETAARMGKGGSPTVNVAAPNVSVPITNVVQGDITSDLDSPEGEEGVLNIIRRNPDTVRQS